MERDDNKRKSSQEVLYDVSDSKYRKIQCQSVNNRDNSQRSSGITEKIVSLWKTGPGLASIITTQDGRDIVRVQELETKYMEADKIIQSMKKKIIMSEENITELNILLKKETSDRQTLLNKLSTTWEFISNITQHINYIVESLDRFKVETNDLSVKYNNVIIKLRHKSISLESELKQLMNVRQTAVEETQQQLEEKEVELNELKVKCEMLEDQALRENENARKIANELENNNKKLLEMKMEENKLKILISQLEEMIIVEKNKLEEIKTIEDKKCDEIRDKYELKIFEMQKQFEMIEKQLQDIEKNRCEILKCLDEKDKLIKNQEQEVDQCQKQVREIMCQMTDTGLNFQRTKDEKAGLENKLLKISAELSQFQQNLETMTMEKRALTKEITELKDNVKKETKERMKLSADLTRSRMQLQEVKNQNNNINQHLDNEIEEKQHDIKSLQMQIENLKQELNQVSMDRAAEIRGRIEIEEKYKNEMKIQREQYEKCLLDLDKLSNSMEMVRKKDLTMKAALSNATADKKKLKQVYSNEKKTIEEKLNKSEELLADKTNMEKELKDKLSILQNDLAIAEKNYKILESEKDNKIMLLEKKLSNIELTATTQLTTAVQQKTPTRTTKNIHMKKEEVINDKKVKSILKPIINTYSPKVPPAASPKKISFNFGSDSSDDVHDIRNQNSMSQHDDKSEGLERTQSRLSMIQLTGSQSVNETSKAKKFFKSRSIL